MQAEERIKRTDGSARITGLGSSACDPRSLDGDEKGNPTCDMREEEEAVRVTSDEPEGCEEDDQDGNQAS